MSAQDIGAGTIEACRRGDRDAFRALYDAHKDRVYSIALHFFHGDRSTASDVTQQVFMKLLADITSFRGESGFSTWLYRLVVNACVDETRRGRTREAPRDPTALPALPIAAGQEVQLATAETARAVQAAVSSLPPKYRLAILLRYFDDLSYDEMASALNCSAGTVASRLSRGHRLLAERLRHMRGGLTA